MNKLLIYLLLLAAVSIFVVFGTVVKYGDNQATGKYYSINGFKMYVESYGNGKPLLMIHGNGGSISTFANTIPYFAQKYRVIATDSRSQGKSVDKADSLTFEQMADDEVELLRQMHIDSAYVLGWSDGGVIAILMAIKHPRYVKMFASSGANLTQDSNAIGSKTWIEQSGRYKRDEHKKLVTDAEKHEWKIFLLDWLHPNISLERVHHISCPALIIGGDHDIIPVKHTKKIFANIKTAQLWIVKNSGHATLIEHAEEFNKRVDDFFINGAKNDSY